MGLAQPPVRRHRLHGLSQEEVLATGVSCLKVAKDLLDDLGV